MLAAIGIQKGKPFTPDAHTRDLLDKAARTASRIGHASSRDAPHPACEELVNRKPPDCADRACCTP